MRESVGNPNLLSESRSKVGMLQKLDVLGRDRPNSHTLSGLYMLGAELQSRMYSTAESMWPSEVRNGLSQAGTELASRVGITLIDRSDISLSYEQGNLNAWLRSKGLKVELDSSKQFDYPISWDELPTGVRESDHYFSDQEMDPQQFQVLAESVAAKFGSMRDLAVEKYGQNAEQTRLLDMASAVQLAVSAEIGSIVSGQGGLKAEQVRELVGPQLKAVGFSLTERGK